MELDARGRRRGAAPIAGPPATGRTRRRSSPSWCSRPVTARLARMGRLVAGIESLSVLTTNRDFVTDPLCPSWATSAATGEAARMARRSWQQIPTIGRRRSVPSWFIAEVDARNVRTVQEREGRKAVHSSSRASSATAFRASFAPWSRRKAILRLLRRRPSSRS